MKRDMQIVTLLQKMKQKRVLRRVIAFLSVIVLLVTVNSLKFEADTLEHLPTCGLEEHGHEEACFDENGALSCALTEHVHTDACFQNRPVKAAEADIEQPVEEMQTFELGDDADDELNASAVSAESAMLDDGIEAAADELDVFELGESEAVAPNFAAKREGYTVGSQYPFLLSDVIAEQGLNISINDVTRIEQLFENGEPALFRYELMDGDIALYPTADFELARLLIYTDNDVELVELLFGIAPTAETVPDDEAEQAIYVETEEKAEPIEPDEETETTEETEVETETIEETETVEETETDDEAEQAIYVETEEKAEPIEADEETETDDETEQAIYVETEEKAEPIGADEETETVEETDAEQPGENDGEATDEARLEVISADVAPAMHQAEATVSHYAATIDLSSVDTFPIALDALMAQAERVTIEEAMQFVDATIEPLGETIEPALDEIEASIEETTATLEDVVETQGEGEVSETLKPLESEAIEPMLGEITVELGESEAPEATSDDTATPDDWTLNYDAALLSIERTEAGYMLSVTGSFEQTAVTVNNGELYVLTLLNGAVRSEYPAATFSAATDHVIVDVDAPEGAFPAGTTMAVTDVEDEDTISNIAGKVEEGFVKVERVHAVDITFLNAEGAEIEPLIPISVVMSVREVEAEKETLVVHVDHDGEAQVVGETTQVVTEVDGEELTAEADTALAFVADAFSVYAVVVGEKLETKAIAADGNTYHIEVTFAENAGLPDGAALAVSEVTDETYLAQVQQSMAGEKRVTMARFFDIKIVNGDEEIQPAAPVTVRVALDSDAEKEADAVPCAVHFTDDEISVVKATEADEAVSFRAESFSVWGVVYTVDFHNEVDGEAYTYTLTGGGAVRLSDIVRALHLAETNIEAPVEEANELTDEEPAELTDEEPADIEDEQLARFMEGVASVTFSDPSLVWVGKVEAETTVGDIKAQYELKPQYSLDMSLEDVREADAQTIAAGDWALISLLPFDTEEALTIEMNDGRTFVLHVTDAKKTTFDDLNDLNGKTYAVVCMTNNALLTADYHSYGRLVAEQVDPSTLEAPTSVWLFERNYNYGSNYGKFRISCNGKYLNINGYSLSVSNNEQWLTVYQYTDYQGQPQIKIQDDYGFAVDLSGGSVSNGFQAYQNGNILYECFYLYHVIVDEKEYVIYTKIDNTYYVLKTDGSTETRSSLSDLDKLSADYRWNVNYKYSKDGTPFYNIVPVHDSTKSLALNWDFNPLVQNSINNVIITDDGDGVQIHFNPRNVDHEVYLKNAGDNFYADKHYGSAEQAETRIYFYEQQPLSVFEFTVRSESEIKGTVYDADHTGAYGRGVDQFDDAQAGVFPGDTVKRNLKEIKAYDGGPLGQSGGYKYIFDYWKLNDELLTNNSGALMGATIQPGQIVIPDSGAVLTAYYKRNPNYVPKDDDKNSRYIDKASLKDWLFKLKTTQMPLDPDACDKTAEVYDYENRIYRVDLTSRSSLSTFSGTIDLGFIIDVSPSMLFPSKLVPTDVTTQSSSDGNVNLKSLNGWHDIGWNNRVQWYQTWGLDTSKQYYIISDEAGTATVFLLHYYDNNWYVVDASAYELNGTVGELAENASNVLKATAANNYDNNYKYTIYVDGDNGKKRSDYLEASIEGTLKTLKDILSIISLSESGSADPTVKIAWNTFKNYLPDKTDSQNGKTRQPTFTDVTGSGINLYYVYEGGGTSTDIALLDAVGVRRSDVTNYNHYYADYKVEYYDYEEQKNKKTEPYRLWDNGTYTSRTYYRSDGQAVNWWNGTPTNVSDPYNYGLKWENSATKYAVLITDGAPQRNGTAIDDRYVEEAAKILKARGIELITVGLGMGNVKKGRRLLYNIASKDSDNDPYFYSAETGDELEYVLYGIIKEIMKPCNVFGDVTDKVGEAFYPVNKANGKPLVVGDWIDLNGNLISGSYSGPHGVIGFDTANNTYTVTWTDQEFCHAETGESWHGTIYIKAEEDFLGGNVVKTNMGDAVIEAKKYQIQGTTDKIDLKTDPVNHTFEIDGVTYPSVYDPKIDDLKSPRVNVNELNFTQNSTEWTVYVGTEVDPLPQIKALYDQIRIEEVITANNPQKPEQTLDENSLRFPVMESDRDDRDRTATGTPLTMYLKDVITQLAAEPNQPTLDWTELLRLSGLEGDANTGITFRYDIYTPNYSTSIDANDRDYPGTINIKLVRNHDTAKHTADTVGERVEEYSLHVLFTPEQDSVPIGQGGDGTVEFHTGSWRIGTPGSMAGTETSTNNHIINVIKRVIELKKTNMNGDLIGEAKFKIYQKDADQQEINVREVTTENGVYTWDPVPPVLDQKKPGDYWQDSTVYYIRETEAPTDHQKYGGEITVTLNMGDAQTYMVQNGPYNWTQTPTLAVTGGADFAEYVTVSTLYEQNEDAEPPADPSDVLEPPELGRTVAVRNRMSIPIGIDKTDTSGARLAGASFKLVKGDTLLTSADYSVVNKAERNEEEVSIPISDEGAFVVPIEGAVLRGLGAGEYTLTEVSSPAGYIITLKPITFTIAADGTVTYTNTEGNPDGKVVPTSDSRNYTVQNEAGARLPATGGPGTAIFTATGLAMIALAVFLMLRRKEEY